ncbi:MAG: hypothetical protein SGI72_12825 [Planctomycetota bacterium]|nr:hypothetical protein [Planctomycetota bacterium]
MKPRAGRVLVVDPVKWTIVRELAGDGSEGEFGGLCSAAHTGDRSYLAVTSVVKGEPRWLLRLIDVADLSTVWTDTIEIDPSNRHSYPNPLCVVDGDDPVVFLLERSKAALDDPEHLVLWRRVLKGRTCIGHLRDGYLLRSGQNTCPHYDLKGKLDGIFVSSIDDYSPPDTRLFFENQSRVAWFDLATGKSVPVCRTAEDTAAAGVELLGFSAPHGRFVGDAIAVRRVRAGGGQLVMLTRRGTVSQLEFPA